MRWLRRWYYHRRFMAAYRTLRDSYKRHHDAGHEVYFNATGPTDIHLTCVNCPEYHPMPRKPEEVERLFRDSHGRPYWG